MKNIAVILILCFTSFSCGESTSKSKRQNHNNILAYNLLADQIKKQILISPSSAVFPSSREKVEHTEYLGDHTYFIKSFVESQNRLGVMIKTNFSSKVIFYSNGDVGFPEFKTE